MKTHLCATCGEQKPSFKFKRKLTLAETKVHNPNAQRRMIVDSKNCAECRAKRKKPVSSKSLKEIQNLKAVGAVSQYQFEKLTAIRNARVKQARIMAIENSWESRYRLAWDLYLVSALKHKRAVQNARAYLQRLIKNSNSNSNTHPLTPSPQLVSFYDQYYDLINATLTKLNMTRSMGRSGHAPKHLPINPSTLNITNVFEPLGLTHDWVRYVPVSARRAVRAEWEKLSLAERIRLVEPVALFWREEVDTDK